MKHFLYRIFCGIAFFILIPIVFTLLIQGNGDNYFISQESVAEIGTEESELDEDILTGIVANEISMDTNKEAMKAQTVIARTNCLRAIETGENLPEGLTKSEMLKMWGQENFSENFSLLETCIIETRGVTMTCGGSYIQADFHRCSAGYTRDAAALYGSEEFPYLKSADSRMDITSKEFLKVMFYTPEQFIQKGGEIFSGLSPEDVYSKISITGKDQAGYVTEFTIDGKPYSGEEIRLLYNWNSSAFSLKETDGKIRVITKGMGHGLGLSLYGANQLASEGYEYKDILKYYFAGIEFVTQYD